MCWKASVIVSTAEIGKIHLDEMLQQQGTANQEAEQINSCDEDDDVPRFCRASLGWTAESLPCAESKRGCRYALGYS